MKPQKKYINKVQSLLEYPREQEWFESKANWFEPNTLGEYISALANAAAYHGRDFGYFVWGIEDKKHAIMGTDFDQTQEMKHEPLTYYLEWQLAQVPLPSMSWKWRASALSSWKLRLQRRSRPLL